MEHLEVLEYSRIFISNPEYQILFRNLTSQEQNELIAQRFRTLINDHTTC